MKFTEFCRSVPGKIISSLDDILDKIPSRKRRFLVLALAGIVLLGLCLTIAALAAGRQRSEPVRAAASAGIPGEDLFYPAEPDFVPALLPEREQRKSWTPEDIRQFWKPLGAYQEEWRETAKMVIDELMKSVP